MEYQNLLNLLLEHNLTLSCMESLTGGLFASTFTGIPSASKAFKGGAITYTDEAKEAFCVSKKTIAENGAISMACAKEMAVQAGIFFNSDISVSFTGNAGPTESESKPVGLVYIAVKFLNEVAVYELHLSGTRNSIRKQCVDFAFSTLIDDLSKKNS